MKKVAYYKLFGKFFVELIDLDDDFGCGWGLPNESILLVPFDCEGTCSGKIT